MNSKRINPILYFLLVYLLGIFGVHKFIDGNKKQGVLYLCTLGLCGFGWMYDFIKAGIIAVKYLFNRDAYNTDSSTENKITKVTTSDGYSFIFIGHSIDIMKNNKEYFNGDIVLKSNYNQSFLLFGYKSNNNEDECVAFISENQLKFMLTDCYFNFGYISNNGVVVFAADGDCGEHIIILSNNRKIKHETDFPLEEKYSLLSNDFCIFAFYDTDELFIISINMNTLKISLFEEEIENIKSKDENINLSLSNNVLNISFSTNEFLQFNLDNEIELIN